MLKVWTDGAEGGLLDRFRDRGSSFAYSPLSSAKANSLASPICWSNLIFGPQR